MSAGERQIALRDTCQTIDVARLQASEAVERAVGTQRRSRSSLQADLVARGFGTLLWLMPWTTPKGADYFERSRNRVGLSIFKNMSVNSTEPCKASVGHARGAQ